MIARLLRRFGPAFIGASVGLIVVLLLITAQTNHGSLNLIRSCTTPGQACYQRGQAQTAAAVQQITKLQAQAAAASAACAAGQTHPTYASVLACEQRALAAANR